MLLTCMAKSVAVYQGATALTRIPSAAHSQVKLLVNWFSAAFVIAYIEPDLHAGRGACANRIQQLAGSGFQEVQADCGGFEVLMR